MSRDTSSGSAAAPYHLLGKTDVDQVAPSWFAQTQPGSAAPGGGVFDAPTPVAASPLELLTPVDPPRALLDSPTAVLDSNFVTREIPAHELQALLLELEPRAAQAERERATALEQVLPKEPATVETSAPPLAPPPPAHGAARSHLELALQSEPRASSADGPALQQRVPFLASRQLQLPAFESAPASQTVGPRRLPPSLAGGCRLESELTCAAPGGGDSGDTDRIHVLTSPGAATPRQARPGGYPPRVQIAPLVATRAGRPTPPTPTPPRVASAGLPVLGRPRGAAPARVFAVASVTFLLLAVGALIGALATSGVVPVPAAPFDASATLRAP